MNSKNLYKNKTLNLAAFLMTKGCQLLNIEREGKQCVFVFEDSQELLQLVESFLYSPEDDDDVMVDSRILLNSIKDLKIKMYI